jgi:hypothetical protein
MLLSGKFFFEKLGIGGPESGGPELNASYWFMATVPKSKLEPPYCFLHSRNCVNLLYVQQYFFYEKR